MDNANAPERRWYQFGLGSLLLLMLLAGIIAFGVSEHRARLRLEAEFDAFKAAIFEQSIPSWPSAQSTPFIDGTSNTFSMGESVWNPGQKPPEGLPP